MKRQNILYHGTCRAFLAYALENKCLFGDENGKLSLTTELSHAIDYAEQWSTKGGFKSIEKYFGEDIEKSLCEPILLELNSKSIKKIKNLRYNNDCGRGEYYLEGNLSLDFVKQIYFKEGIEDLKGGR